MGKDSEQLKLKRMNKKPLAYCKWMTDRPHLFFGLTLGGHILIMMINFILLGAGYDILPVVFDDFPVNIKKDLSHQRENAWNERDVDNNKIRRFTIDDIGPTWDRGYHIDTVTLFYTGNGKQTNMFQKKYFIQMQVIEDEIFYVKEYQSSFCQLNKDQICLKPNSVLRYFDGTYSNISNVFYDPTFDNIPTVLYEARHNAETRDDFQYFLAEGYIITPTEAFSNATRTGFNLGWPLEGPGDNDAKATIIEQFFQDHFKPELERVQKKPHDGLNLNYFSRRLFQIDIFPNTINDMMLAIGSLGFIVIFVWIQTGSFWITGWSILSIITCFWITNLVYRTIINYAYFGFFHVIAIFIILGIGADDVFVFFNTWKATALDEYPSLAHRMSDTYRRAAGTMFFTSFTTMMAFLIGGISPVLPLGSFGIFTGVLVAVNYISVIIFFPNVVLMHHLYFEKRCCTCCLCPHERPRRSCCSRKNSISSEEDISRKEPDRVRREKRKHPIVRFFGGPYFRFVTHKVARWIIIVVYTAFLGFFIWSATRIEPSTEEIRIYRENNNYGKAMALDSTAFIPSGDHFVNMYLVWGLTPTDFSSCHFTDHACKGERQYDDSFDMNTPQVQQSLMDLCNKIKYGLTSEEIAKLHIRNDSDTGQLEVDCFMDDLQTYLLTEQIKLNTTVDLTYPLSYDNIVPFIHSHLNIYEPEKLSRQFYRYFEIGVSSWISGGYSMLTTPDFLTYDRLIGEVKDPPFTQPVKVHYDLTNGTGPFGYYGTKLRYAAIQVNLTLDNSGLGYTQGLPVYNSWDTFLQEQMSQMPSNMRGGFPVAGNWHWLVVQETLERGAWFGMGIGIAIACVVLILATTNIMVGLLATLLIGCVTAGVVGVIPLAGWKIDVMISMNLALLVGLSVDYIIHIAEGYHLSEHTGRLDRVRDMLENLGISILSGALTTLGAAFFMLFSKLQFFFQFGTFLFCIIGFSMAYSLMFFPALMSLIGPEGNTGSIITPFKKLHYKVIGRDKNDVTCLDCNGTGFQKPPSNKSKVSLLDSNKKSKKSRNEAGVNGPYDEMKVMSDEEYGRRSLTNGHVMISAEDQPKSNEVTLTDLEMMTPL